MKTPHPVLRREPQTASADPRVLRWTRHVALAGLALVLVWPSARGYNPWIGWLPLWLLGMPAAAWWSLYRFRFPARLYARHRARQQRRGPQARRTRKPGRARLTRAA